MSNPEWTQPPLPLPSDVKLIVCDVDGTLLTSSHQLHPLTKSAILHVRKTRPELPIVIASGKQLVSVQWIRDELQLQDFPSLHCNGAVVYGFAQSSSSPSSSSTTTELVPSSTSSSSPPRELSVLKEHYHSPALVRSIVDLMTTLDRATFLFLRDEVLYINRERREGARDWYELAGRYDKCLIDVTGDKEREEALNKVDKGEWKIVKITVACEPEDAEATLLELAKFSSDSLSFVRAIPEIIELMVPGVDKSVALRELCDSLEIPLTKVLAFGDGDNDEGMLRSAGLGCAMGNAMERSRTAARYRTGRNDEGGVGMFLDGVFR